LTALGSALTRVVAAALLIGACSGGGGDQDQGVPAGPFALGLAVGDCFDRPASADVESVDPVPCDRAHDFEVFAQVDLDDGPYPGDREIGGDGHRACDDPFADYVGRAQNRSGLVVVPVTPDEASWKSGQREVACVAGGPGGVQLEGTVEGSE
jgi:hypothetical protein